ncbi:MAG TPA: amidohydrolase family protein [Nitrososphaera sp.]|nr:amidohydrolase family protein [Nitrososphaera sp.]
MQDYSGRRRNDNIGVVAGYSLDNYTDDDSKFYGECLKDGQIKGLMLYCGYEHYYPFDNRYQKIYDLCVEYGVPAMFHTGDTFSARGNRYSRPLNIDEVAVYNPELTIMICHLGNPWILDCGLSLIL